MRMIKYIIPVIALSLLILWKGATSAYAIAYDLIPPEGTLQRGQDVQFTISIDTQNTTVSTATIGMQYNTEGNFLQYKSITQGEAMTSVTATPNGTNSLVITGTNTNGFSGSGVFAYVTFTIIATAPGEAELCTLVPITPTPTLPPNAPTQPPVPTQLPVTGTGDISGPGIIGLIMFTSSIATFLALRRLSYKRVAKRR